MTLVFVSRRRQIPEEYFFTFLYFYPVASHCSNTVAAMCSILIVYKEIALPYCWLTQVKSCAVSDYLKQKRKNISPKKKDRLRPMEKNDG